MAIYRIFPEKDATIYSQQSLTGHFINTGADPILTISSYPDSFLTGQSSRALIQFKTQDILDTVNTIVSGSYLNTLHLYMANTSELLDNQILECHAISGSWKEGNGQYRDVPANTSGVSWKYREEEESLPWIVEGGDILPYSNSAEIVRFSDLDFNVTNTVTAIVGSTIENNGFLVKLQNALEFETGSSTFINYFSSNSHTIYSPYLEFKWNDFYRSSSLPQISTPDYEIRVKNLSKTYNTEGKKRFRINVKPKYPSRVFSTSSLYLDNYILPQNSYWGIKDAHTEEMIVDFDTTYTKLNADNTGNYFDLHLNTLYPERFYRIVIKSEVEGNIDIVQIPETFKTSQNV